MQDDLILKQNNLFSIYRVQNLNNEMNYFLPVKRVIVNKSGHIDFNPDPNRYIYFSRSYKHHTYYIFHKVFDIIRSVIKYTHKNLRLTEKSIPSTQHIFGSYQTVNVKQVKLIQDLFKNYYPPFVLELVKFDCLPSYASVFDKCCIDNRIKVEGFRIPEVSDCSIYGGAYGINDAWLELLKSCITLSTHTHFTFDDVFEYLIKYSYKAKSKCSVENYRPFYFDMLNKLHYIEVKNPIFYDKNNINYVTQSLIKIHKKSLYNISKLHMEERFLDQTKRDMRLEIEQLR